jgi:serine protease
MRRLSLVLLSLLYSLSSSPALAGNEVGKPASAALRADADGTDRFIVKLRDPAADPRPALAAIGGTFGERLEHVRRMSGGAHVVRLGRRVMNLEAHAVAGRLRSDPRVVLIEPDVVMHPMLVPNDTMYAQQWHYYEAQGGINLPAAWDRTTGAASITVAVIDTGVLPHADLASRLAPGYDFVAGVAGGSDPGDYGCNGSTSSWHGTHVAGTIGAVSNNANGVTGVNWGSRILPVRVLGRCGGYTSDIADGMRWAAGIAVTGVPANPFPARVENLSLGGTGSCSSTLQSAVNDVVARGTVVVVAAGNAAADVGNTQPASCNGVIAVAATTRSGGRASYSNFGPKVTVSAPGGGGGDSILSTLNTGLTTPAADAYAWFQGTSMATPHVSGVASLVLSLDPTLTPAQVAQRLQQAARPFPSGTGSDCSVGVCGAGIVDAAASVNAVAPAPPPPPPPPPPPDTGWTKIADEGQAFTVSGTQTVRYGHAPYWITATVTGAGSCTNAFFATDPIVGTVKQCEVQASAGSPPCGLDEDRRRRPVVQRRRRADGALRQRLCVGDPQRRRLRRVHELVLRERSPVRRRQAMRGGGFSDDSTTGGVDAGGDRRAAVQCRRNPDRSIRRGRFLAHQERDEQRRLHQRVLRRRSRRRHRQALRGREQRGDRVALIARRAPIS